MSDLKPVQGLRPFTKFCMTIGNLPASYLAGMTYEEQLLWFCNFLQNEVIPTVNNNGEAVEELQNLYIQLKNYVDNYFNNLDVQQEINNKLDEMASNGTLTNLLKDYLQPILNEQNTKISQMNNNLVNGLASARQKNVLINMSDLAQDVKTAMTGGSVAVTGQNSVQNENIVNNTITQSKMYDAVLTEYGNLIEYSKCSISKTLNESGQETDSSVRDTSDFIPILGSNYVVGNNNSYEVFYYTIDKTYISKQFPNTSNLVNLVIPENAKFFRVTMYKSTYASYGQYPYVAINKDKYIGNFGNQAGSATITIPLYTKNDIIFTNDNFINNSLSQEKFDINTFNLINKNPEFEISNMGNLFDRRLIIKNVMFTNLNTENYNEDEKFITSYNIPIKSSHQYECWTLGNYYLKWLNENEETISVEIMTGLKNFTPPSTAKFAIISGNLNQLEDKTSSQYLQFVDRTINVVTGANQVVDPVYIAKYLYTSATELYPELSNKKMCFFGDSWCAGNSSYPGGWASYIKSNTYNTVCDNKGQNGSTWSQCYNNYLSQEKINELDDDYDIICIEAFTNGLYTDTPYKTIGEVNNTLFNSIDEINSQMIDTICRDIELCLFQIAHKYAGKRICIIFPYQSRSQAYNNACFKDTIPLVKQIASKYSIKVFDDFYTSNIPTFTRDYYWDEGEETPNEKIGTHLNQLGYPIVGKNIIQHLNNWS